MRKSLKLHIAASVGLIALVVLTCVGIYARPFTLPPPQFELPQETVNYTHYLPPAAEIIEARTDVADIFGDFSLGASFRLPNTEVDELLEKGFDWFPPANSEHSSKSNWRTGTLPHNVLQPIENLESIRLEDGPKNSIIYTYLYESADGGWWRLVAIDEERDLIYYYRVSW